MVLEAPWMDRLAKGIPLGDIQVMHRVLKVLQQRLRDERDEGLEG